MARALRLAAAAGCAACAFAAGALADAWSGDGSSGQLEFSATQAGARFTGRFREFHVDLELDAAHPGHGRLHVTVATGSADTQDDDRDAILRSEDFFWSGRHPEAVFHADSLEPDGKGWRAPGTLTLRGVSRPVVVRFTTMGADGKLSMKGGSKLARLAFGVGQGDWASTEWIGDEVAIAFELSLRPAAAAASP